MTSRAADRDGDAAGEHNASYRAAYLFLAYGLLASVMYRGFVRAEQPWDLLALVVLSGGVATLYQWRQRAPSRSWAAMTIAVAVAALLLAATLALLRGAT